MSDLIATPPMERYPDVKAVRLTARAEWERSARRRIGIQERIGATVPWWLILIALAFYLLSAPHTAAIFDKLAPGWGWVAPIAVEFSLLYAAFRKAILKQEGKHVPRGVRGLELFAFIVAIIVNGAGSFISVADSVGIGELSIRELGARLPDLPASSQVALALVPLAALIIPIGTGVAGEGVAALITERRETGGLLDREWQRVRIEIEFVALRDAAVQNGIQPGKASKWAASLVGETRVSGGSSARQLSAVSASDDNGRMADGQPDTSAEATGHGNGQGYTRRADARTVVREYLEQHPDAVNLSVRDLASASGVGKTVASEVLSAYKIERNL